MIKAAGTVTDIKSSLPISVVIKDAVELKGAGPHFVGLCPFHQEKTPSFNVWDNQGTFKCFGCGAFGDIFEFVMRLRGLSFSEAKSELAERAGVRALPVVPVASKNKAVTTMDPLLHAQNVAQDFFIRSLQEKSGAAAKQYLLQQRGLNEGMIVQAGIGFGGASYDEFVAFLQKNKVSADHALKAGLLKPTTFSKQATFLGRITFPIKSFLGKIIAFGGRSFLEVNDTTPKYVNTHAYSYYEKRRAFYGLFEAKPAILKGHAPVLVEGYFDALAVWAAGMPALALCGTALSPEHIKILKRLCSKVILCFDSDNAGAKALRASLSLLLHSNFTVGAVELSKNDPGEYQSQGEIQALKEIISAPQDALVSLIDTVSLSAQKSVGSRIAEIEQLTSVLAAITRPIVRRQYVAHLAKGINEDPGLLWREIEALVRKKGPKKENIEIKPQETFKITARDKIVLQALRAFPALLAEITPIILQELSSPIRVLVEEFREANESSFTSYLMSKDQNLSQALLAATPLEIPFKFDELQEIMKAIHRQIEMNGTKKTLQEKRHQLQLAQKKNDMSSILKTLAEQSAILAKSKPKPVKIVEKIFSPQVVPVKVTRKSNFGEMDDALQMLPEEDDWV